MIKKYKVKPIEAEAIQYTGTNYSELCLFLQMNLDDGEYECKEENALNASIDVLNKRRREEPFRNFSHERIFKISGTLNLEIFKKDYLVLYKDKFYCYTEKSFNNLFIENV